MSDGVASFASVVPFSRSCSGRGSLPEIERTALLDAVGAAGCVMIAPRAFAARHAAAALHLMGFVSLEEVQPDGAARRLKASEAMSATPLLPWRVARIGGR
jgi:hypothetical protein